MLLGKRPRARHPSMKRTTSMTEFSFDDLSTLHPSQEDGQVAASEPSDHNQNKTMMSLVSPRMMLDRRNSADFALHQQQSVAFLRTCALCRRRLVPARDIFMYRGDSAFCSLECRQQQMTKDEWKEKCSVVGSSTKKESNSSTVNSSTAASTISSSKEETIIAL